MRLPPALPKGVWRRVAARATDGGRRRKLLRLAPQLVAPNLTSHADEAYSKKSLRTTTKICT